LHLQEPIIMLQLVEYHAAHNREKCFTVNDLTWFISAFGESIVHSCQYSYATLWRKECLGMNEALKYSFCSFKS